MLSRAGPDNIRRRSISQRQRKGFANFPLGKRSPSSSFATAVPTACHPDVPAKSPLGRSAQGSSSARRKAGSPPYEGSPGTPPQSTLPPAGGRSASGQIPRIQDSGSPGKRYDVFPRTASSAWAICSLTTPPPPDHSPAHKPRRGNSFTAPPKGCPAARDGSTTAPPQGLPCQRADDRRPLSPAVRAKSVVLQQHRCRGGDGLCQRVMGGKIAIIGTLHPCSARPSSCKPSPRPGQGRYPSGRQHFPVAVGDAGHLRSMPASMAR